MLYKFENYLPVIYEANLLIRYAKEGKIENLNIEGLNKGLQK